CVRGLGYSVVTTTTVCNVQRVSSMPSHVYITLPWLGYRYFISTHLSALCWACKLVMKKLKRILGPNATEERITTKLKVICNELGLLKSRCHRFVEKHLRVLVKELTTKDDVKTVCIKIRACR
uniref:Saposin B-type domain-containing protein n=1 Tax=Cyprinodon variegatus TaxID=28743 RepID=A0A3Q2EHM7_CYPVA